MSTPAQLRELGPADAPAFQALRLRGLRECPSAFASSHEEECGRPLDAVAARLAASPQRCVIGAFEGDALAGLVGLVQEEHRKLAHKGFIWGMYVRPESRRGGVGAALVGAALERARAMGLRQVNLGVNAANAPALALYESLGFEPYGLERGFMLLDGVLHDEVQMVRVLP